MEQFPCGAHVEETATGYPTEADACRAFDAAAEKSGLFTICREVRGDMIQLTHWKRPNGQLRIDRLLLPTQKLVEAGWTGGAIGIEIKKSGTKVGPVLSQMGDYLRCSWIGPRNIRVNLSYCFLFPMSKCGNAVASIMAQNHIGTALLHYSPKSEHYRLEFFIGEQSVLIHYLNSGKTEIKNLNLGNRTGNRQ